MFRNLRKLKGKLYYASTVTPGRSFLTNNYMCNDAWNAVNSSSLLNKINLNDFYNIIEQTYTSKGVISAIDVDLFANAVRDSTHLDELKDLLHKLRLSAETGSTLESTHYATIRNFINFGLIEELVDILKDPHNFGIFLDNYNANILLHTLLSQHNYQLAANVASLVMLQEEFSNEITCTLCQYACYKYILGYKPQNPVPETVEKNKKVEEVKIRVKYLRNPYFDDHFDIKDLLTLSGKTLAWISERSIDNLNMNLQIIGWLIYKKYDKLLNLCEKLKTEVSFKVYKEVVDLLKLDNDVSPEVKDKCISLLIKQDQVNDTIETSLDTAIENAINKVQTNDILSQKQLFKTWSEIREKKLLEQTIRLDRARRMEYIKDKQEKFKEDEQKLWFFENEQQIDLEIEKKEVLKKDVLVKKTASKTDENYIPPEIIKKRK